MERLNVELTYSPNECILKAGAKGYVHAYVRGADDRPYAVVVTEEVIDMIPINALKPQRD